MPKPRKPATSRKRKGQERKLIKRVPSGVPELFPDVEVYDTTLLHLAEAGHHQELARIDEVYECISAPERVYKSKTHDRSIVVVNGNLRSPGGDPIRIPIKIVSAEQAIMSTAHFSSSADHGELLWPVKTESDETES